MAAIEYYSHGKLHRLTVHSVDRLAAGAAPKTAGAGRPSRRMLATMAPSVLTAVQSQADRLAPMFLDVTESAVQLTIPTADGPAILPTPTVVIEGANKSELKRLKDK